MARVFCLVARFQAATGTEQTYRLLDMDVRTCLLVSEDPDDHAHFGEAVYEIAPDIVLMVVLDVAQAARLLSAKRHVPDYIIVDLSSNEFDNESFFGVIHRDAQLSAVPVIAYGQLSEISGMDQERVAAFVDADMSFSRLRSVLRKVFRPEANPLSGADEKIPPG